MIAGGDKMDVFDLGVFKEYNSVLTKENNGYICTFDKALGYIYADKDIVSLGGIDWSGKKYIVIDVTSDNDWVFGLTLGFWKKANKTSRYDLSVTLGLIPHIRTTLSFDLSNLDSQTMFLDRTPGKLKTVVFGEKMSLGEIGRFAIGTDKCFEKQKITLHSVYLSHDEPAYPPPDVKLVDELGQNMTNDWPGKTNCTAQSIAYLNDEYIAAHKNAAQTNAPFSDERDRYGGWKGKKFEATGYFRTQFDGYRWHLADPDGYDFYSIGLDSIRPDDSARIDGIEKFFTYLPDDEKYVDAWHKPKNAGEVKFFSFPVANLIRAFGSDWKDKWSDITRHRINQWGFNTIGNWSDLSFAHDAKMPYVLPLEYKNIQGFSGRIRRRI